MIETLAGWQDWWIWPFILIISFLIAFHELGHYLAARWCGVTVEAFSIGFGREIFGWNDRRGTRWRVAILPLGGYVRMLGDADAASATRDAENARRPDSFDAQSVGRRALIVFAGPAANFLLAVVILAGLFLAIGRPATQPIVGSVVADSAAEAAGVLPGDLVLAIDGQTVARFEDLASYVSLRPEMAMTLTVERDGRALALPVTPRAVTLEDAPGGPQRIGRLGVSSAGLSARDSVGPWGALTAAAQETWSIGANTLTALGQIIGGTRSVEELGGPLRIAQVSSDAASIGIVALLTLAAILSVNLGLLNLFPIPMLDGGHLVFYAFEAVRGRPLGERAQEYGLRIGLAAVIALMVFVTWNDLSQMLPASLFGGAS